MCGARIKWPVPRVACPQNNCDEPFAEPARSSLSDPLRSFRLLAVYIGTDFFASLLVVPIPRIAGIAQTIANWRRLPKSACAQTPQPPKPTRPPPGQILDGLRVLCGMTFTKRGFVTSSLRHILLSTPT